MVQKQERASEAQFSRLIAERSSTVREALKWKDRVVSARFHERTAFAGITYNPGSDEFTLADCNCFYVTLKHTGGGQDSVPVRFIAPAFDYVAERPRLEIIPK
jgi:hypothetical protein